MNMDTIYDSHECAPLGLMSSMWQHDRLSENMALTPHTPTTLHFCTIKRGCSGNDKKFVCAMLANSAKCLIKENQP